MSDLRWQRVGFKGGVRRFLALVVPVLLGWVAGQVSVGEVPDAGDWRRLGLILAIWAGLWGGFHFVAQPVGRYVAKALFARLGRRRASALFRSDE